MQTRQRVFDDIARVAGGAAGVVAGLKDEIEARVRQQLERVLDGLELVERDEFEAVKAMAAEARAENERLAKRLAALEKKLSGPKSAAKKTSTAKNAPRKAARKA